MGKNNDFIHARDTIRVMISIQFYRNYTGYIEPNINVGQSKFSVKESYFPQCHTISGHHHRWSPPSVTNKSLLENTSLSLLLERTTCRFIVPSSTAQFSKRQGMLMGAIFSHGRIQLYLCFVCTFLSHPHFARLTHHCYL